MGGGPMGALRLLVGWVVVIGLSVFVAQNPDQVMVAIDYAIETIAQWIDQHVHVY